MTTSSLQSDRSLVWRGNLWSEINLLLNVSRQDILPKDSSNHFPSPKDSFRLSVALETTDQLQESSQQQPGSPESHLSGDISAVSCTINRKEHVISGTYCGEENIPDSEENFLLFKFQPKMKVDEIGAIKPLVKFNAAEKSSTGIRGTLSCKIHQDAFQSFETEFVVATTLEFERNNLSHKSYPHIHSHSEVVRSLPIA